MSRSKSFPCVEDIQMLRSRSPSFYDDEPSKMPRVEFDESVGEDDSVVTSFSVTCEVVEIQGRPNERAQLKFTVIPRVASNPPSNVYSIPAAFRTNCLNQYPGFRTNPIYVGLIPYVQSSDDLTMEYVGPITSSAQEVGNIVLHKTEEYGSSYSETRHHMYEEFVPYQQQISAGSANRFEQYKRSYSAMVGHTFVITLSNANFERITAINGLIDSVIANGVVGIYSRIAEVLDYYQQQFSSPETPRKIEWVRTFGDVSMQRSNVPPPAFPPRGLLNQTIDDHVGIFINKFTHNGASPFYVVGEYITEEQHASQRYLPDDPNDLYYFQSTRYVSYPFDLHAASFAWPLTSGVPGESSNSAF